MILHYSIGNSETRVNTLNVNTTSSTAIDVKEDSSKTKSTSSVALLGREERDPLRYFIRDTQTS